MAEFERFENRRHAGELLAVRLAPRFGALPMTPAAGHTGRADGMPAVADPDLASPRAAGSGALGKAIVLALPRGGVPVGHAIAQRLGIALDVLVVRKLGMPRHEEFAMGAVGGGGVRVLQPGVPGLMGVSAQEVDAVTARELAELARRERLYRGARALPELAGRDVILVDDGIATGSTVLAAIEVVRRMRPGRLTLAVPVAPPDAVRKLAAHVDALVCLATPTPFRSVGQWYDEFEQMNDAEVQALLANSDPHTGDANHEDACDGHAH